jgi:Ca-activated chloride channel family protein
MNRNRPLLRRRHTAAATLGLLLALAPTAAEAQITPVPPRPATPRDIPRPRPIDPSRVVSVESVTVNATVRDGVAETEVSHVFRNHSGANQEADFLFPIPAGATVSSFAMYDGETKFDARLLDKDEATRTYEEIVRRRRDPALLTYQGRGALRARVFPIPPNGQRRVTLKMVTVLPKEGDARKYAWTLIGPYLPGSGAAPTDVSVRVTLTGSQPIGNVYSPTHAVRVRRDSPTKVVASWSSSDADGKATLTENPEFDLYVAPARGGKNVALSVLTYNTGGTQVASLTGAAATRPGYFLVVASPTVTDTARAALPRRVVLVMDRSGSMQGKKIDQAKGALRFALGKLRPQDRFNVVTFSDRTEKFAPDPLAATPENLKKANAFVEDIVADGGTNINDALKTGLAEFPEKSAGNTLLFFTDGLPTVGVRDHDAIVRNAVTENERKARVFVFGVGYDVDVPFLDNVARSLRGDADYVRPDEDIEAKTSQFVAKTSAPVLENLKLTVEGANANEVYPKPDDLPDLFAGGQLVLVGRYAGGAKDVRIRLTGEAAGKPQTYDLAARFPAVDTEAAFLPRLWASRKIGYLMDELRLRSDADVQKEITDQIISLSKDYGILTPYTALFVPEPGTERHDGPMPLLGRRVNPSGAPGNSTLYAAVPSAPMAGGVGGGGGFGGAPSGAAANGPVAVYDAFAPAAKASGAAVGARTRDLRKGESAVNVSQASRAQRTQSQVGNAYAYNQQAGADREAGAALARQIQNVASRTFYNRANIWTDAGFDAAKQKQVVKVKAFSPAYFALTRRNADLAKWAAVGDQVLIAVNATQAVQFGPEGKETLTEAEVKALAGK